MAYPGLTLTILWNRDHPDSKCHGNLRLKATIQAVYLMNQLLYWRHLSALLNIARPTTNSVCAPTQAKQSANRFAVLTISACLLTACAAVVPLQKESPSNHFEVNYVETHPRLTKQEAVNKLGIPGAIFRAEDETYYVYKATGDTDMLLGMPVPVPPFFIPIWKEEGEGGGALHCLALTFDEKGLLQHYTVKSATTQPAEVGIVGPTGGGTLFFLGSKKTAKCAQLLWDEEKILQLQVVTQYKQQGYLEGAVLAFGEVDGVPLVAVADWHGALHLWNVRSDCLMPKSISVEKASITTVAYSEIDNVPVVITGSSDGAVRLWDVRTAHLRSRPMIGHVGAVTDVALIGVDGVPTVISGGEDRKVQLWDARSGQRLEKLSPKGQLVALSERADAAHIATCSADQTLQVWDVRAGRPVGKQLTGHAGRVTEVALGVVDGKPILAAGGADKAIHLWDARSGRLLGKPLSGHEQPVIALTFGQIDGVPVVVSADKDNTIRLWDVHTGLSIGQPLKYIYGGRVTTIILFNIDGMRIIGSASTDRDVRLLDARSGSQLGEMLYLEEVVDMEQLDTEQSNIIEAVTVAGLPDDERWFLAKHGDKEAQLQLYLNLGGVVGLTWLCRAADQAHPEARHRLGGLYEYGGATLLRDYVKAYQWYSLGAMAGDYRSGKAAKRIRNNLTPEQLSHGERLVS